jgi:hypothetical protein
VGVVPKQVTYILYTHTQKESESERERERERRREGVVPKQVTNELAGGRRRSGGQSWKRRRSIGGKALNGFFV